MVCLCGCFCFSYSTFGLGTFYFRVSHSRLALEKNLGPLVFKRNLSEKLEPNTSDSRFLLNSGTVIGSLVISGLNVLINHC